MGESAAAGALLLVPLHRRPDLTPSCAELLNQTWRRSRGARIHSLERSSEDFPVCLVLIGSREGPALGHARLCRVIGLSDSLFVESVVVGVELRGKGYGRKLMEATERYARGRGFRNLYLSTHDKQDFYHHLGYRLTEPVQSMGTLGTLLPPGMFQKMTTSQASLSADRQAVPSSSRKPPPDPSNQEPAIEPAVPPAQGSGQPIPSPPPPPPPPPAPDSSAAVSVGSSLQTPFRDFRGDPIFWMKKSL